jgi:hypothetical protein
MAIIRLRSHANKNQKIHPSLSTSTIYDFPLPPSAVGQVHWRGVGQGIFAARRRKNPPQGHLVFLP